jgi:AraC-like DNA-binding protein/CheY-like chemotaxis protein
MTRPKILIVEDELLIAKNISIILENEGYETTIGITNYDDAVNAITLNKYALVLIDINIQGILDGVDLASYLLKKDNIPFIYITSNADNVTLNRIKETRPYGMIVKPFKSIDIKSTVEIVLNNLEHKKIDVVRYESESIENEVPFILKKVVEYINANIHDKIDIHDLSKMTKWSHQHFIKNFTKFIHQTPYQYILKKKIEKAKALITDEKVLLTNVSLELGFNSYSNFCNAFKKETGKTPENYKKSIIAQKHIK